MDAALAAVYDEMDTVLKAVRPWTTGVMNAGATGRRRRPAAPAQGAAGRRRRGQPAADLDRCQRARFRDHRGTSGPQAIRLLADWLPDVVVLDALMPELDGFDTCRQLRGMPGFESLPVLMLTGRTTTPRSPAPTRPGRPTSSSSRPSGVCWPAAALPAALGRTRQELERNKARLAARAGSRRMGSFDWKRGAGGPVFSVEGLRVFGLGPDRPLVSQPAAHAAHDDRNGLLTVLREVLAQLGAGDRRAGHAARRAPAHRARGGRARVQRARQPGRLHRHRAGRDRPPRGGRPHPPPANFDSLTGLPNRRQLIWRTERALEHARRLGHQVALLLIDLDRFVINDTLATAPATSC